MNLINKGKINFSLWFLHVWEDQVFHEKIDGLQKHLGASDQEQQYQIQAVFKLRFGLHNHSLFPCVPWWNPRFKIRQVKTNSLNISVAE